MAEGAQRTKDHRGLASDTCGFRRDPRPWHHNYLALRANRAVLEHARAALSPRRAGTRVLDVGCGSAPFARLFAESFYVGCDISAAAIGATVLGENASLPFVDNAFDLVISSETLEHTARVDTAITELIRVARPGGVIFVTVPFLYPTHGLPHDYQRLTEPKLRSAFGDCEILCLKPSNSLLSSPLIVLEYALSLVASVSGPTYVASRALGAVISTLALAVEATLTPLVRRLGLVVAGGRRALVDAVLDSAPSGYALLARKPIGVARR